MRKIRSPGLQSICTPNAKGGGSDSDAQSSVEKGPISVVSPFTPAMRLKVEALRHLTPTATLAGPSEPQTSGVEGNGQEAVVAVVHWESL
jgi:hypothetical protein